ncbi:MAG: hypothetical protein H0V29_07740 [Thermoleophilaceae bacterium]|nr:hypothetical protein [Thermoleophilaceae bacterium]
MAKQAATQPLHRIAERVRFCTRCGTMHPALDDGKRVCGDCGMGVLLTAQAGAIADPGDPFLVVSEELRVVAVSQSAEQMFGNEASLLSHPLLSALSSSEGDDALARAVRRAAMGSRDVVTLPVRAASAVARDAGPLEARIAACGPPRAALVVIELALRAL